MLSLLCESAKSFWQFQLSGPVRLVSSGFDSSLALGIQGWNWAAHWWHWVNFLDTFFMLWNVTVTRVIFYCRRIKLLVLLMTSKNSFCRCVTQFLGAQIKAVGKHCFLGISPLWCHKVLWFCTEFLLQSCGRPKRCVGFKIVLPCTAKYVVNYAFKNFQNF